MGLAAAATTLPVTPFMPALAKHAFACRIGPTARPGNGPRAQRPKGLLWDTLPRDSL